MKLWGTKWTLRDQVDRAVLGGSAVTRHIKESKTSLVCLLFPNRITYNLEISSKTLICSTESTRFRPHVPSSIRALLFRFLIYSRSFALQSTEQYRRRRTRASSNPRTVRGGEIAQSALNYGGSHIIAQDAGATVVSSFIGFLR